MKIIRTAIALVIFILSTFLRPVAAVYAIENSSIQQIREIVSKNDITDEEVELLKRYLRDVPVETSGYFGNGTFTYQTRGYGEWHDLGGGWKYRVDKPHGSTDTKPHVHVKGPGVDTVENVDGTKSHGKDLSKVPNWAKKKIKSSPDYKKGQNDLKNMKKAKSQIVDRRLNLKVEKDIVIAIGIFVAVVGFAVFATTQPWAWGPFLLAI